jgi:hypothetical protein
VGGLLPLATLVVASLVTFYWITIVCRWKNMEFCRVAAPLGKTSYFYSCFGLWQQGFSAFHTPLEADISAGGNPLSRHGSLPNCLDLPEAPYSAILCD